MGGHYFEGQLVIWNWETGAWHSELLENRRVDRVAYCDGGARLALVLAPDTDEDEPGPRVVELEGSPAGAGNGYQPDGSYRADPRLEGLLPSATELLDLGLAEAARQLGLEPHAMIWDLAWCADGRLAIAADDGTLTLWRPIADERITVQLPDRRIVSLHRPPSGELVIYGEGRSDRGAGALYSLEDNALRVRHDFDRTYACSMDASGRILARDTAGIADLVIAGGAIERRELGHYDLFNHALRVEGAASLYFLRGTPARSHEHKQLCTLDQTGEDVAWDPETEHYLVGSAIAIDDRSLVRAYIIHDPRGSTAGAIDCLDLESGARAWHVPVNGAVVALAYWPATGYVIASLATRQLVAIELATGTVVHHQPFALRGVETVVTAIAVHAEAIAFATIDGRVTIATSI